MRKTIATLAVAAALIAVPLGNTLPANAATLDNPLARMCGFGHPGTSCTVLVQRQSGQEVLKVREVDGTVHRFTSEDTAADYFEARAPHCRTVSQHSCIGRDGADLYIRIGHTLDYLGDIS